MCGRAQYREVHLFVKIFFENCIADLFSPVLIMKLQHRIWDDYSLRTSEFLVFSESFREPEEEDKLIDIKSETFSPCTFGGKSTKTIGGRQTRSHIARLFFNFFSSSLENFLLGKFLDSALPPSPISLFMIEEISSILFFLFLIDLDPIIGPQELFIYIASSEYWL